jgi:hypothetical protein
MLPTHPLGELNAFLATNARELAHGAPEMPRALANETGRFFLVPAAWAPGGNLVVHFPVTFPDTLPKIYLVNGAARATVKPHVNRPGQICCFEPSTVVNGQAPLAILQAVLAKAETIWTRTHTPEQLLAEVEPELTAYWENGEELPLYLTDDAVEHEWIMGVTEEPLPSGRMMNRVGSISVNKSVRSRLVLMVQVPRSQLIELLAEPARVLPVLADTTRMLQALQDFLRKSPWRKWSVAAWLLLRCETTTGDVLLGLQVKNVLHVDLKKDDVEKVGREWLAKSPLRRVGVQDLRGARLRGRTAGTARRRELADVKVALAGCGSLGGFVADGLARAGVSQWLLLDDEILRPENLARHLLNYRALYRPKAEALKDEIKSRFTDLEVEAQRQSVQTEAGLKQVMAFGPTVLVSATGDTNTDLTLSEHCRGGRLGDCCFVWVEPNLAAGHLVYQPSGCPQGLHDLHEQVGGDAYYYRHRVLTDPRTLQQMEAGCQVAFTPYSGADMQQFAHAAVLEIAQILRTRPAGLLVRRFKQSGWETITP